MRQLLAQHAIVILGLCVLSAVVGCPGAMDTPPSDGVTDGSMDGGSDSSADVPEGGCLDGPQKVESNFEESDESWKVVGGPFVEPTRPSLLEEGGSPAGHVSATGNGEWYWKAPPSFLGALPCSYGETLTFSLNQSNVVYPDARGLVTINGAGLQIAYDAPYAPGTSWTGFTVRFDASEEWYDTETRTRISEFGFRLILASIDDLYIRGWFSNGEGTGGLDTVVLNGKPERICVADDRIQSHFDNGKEGWTVAGGSFGRSGPSEWSRTGGAADGHIAATGSGGWYWLAPPDFLADVSCAYGHRLEFDLNQSDLTYPDSDQLVVLNGGGFAIFYDAAYLPHTTWTGFSVRLDETERWLSFPSRERVTQDQMLAVLSNLQQVKIRGWFSPGYEGTGGLDNVVLNLDENPYPVAVGTEVSSTFDHSLEGWTVAGGSFGRSGPATWSPYEAGPGGHASASGAYAWYWIAPPAYRINASSAYGSNLTFDLNQSTEDYYRDSGGLVVLNGGGHAIYLDEPYLPGAGWTSYAIRLDETERWFHTGSGTRATQSEIMDVLTRLQHIKIRGWFFYSSFEGTGGLDNVDLQLAE